MSLNKFLTTTQFGVAKSVVRPCREPGACDEPAYRDANDIVETLEALKGEWVATEYQDKVEVTEQKILILADAHIPYHDETLLADAFERAQLQGVEAIVWLGDLLDMPTQSSWGNDDPSTYFAREKQIAEGVLREAARYVPRQYWSSGNHEDRLKRKLGNQTDLLDLARMVGVDDLIRSDRLVISEDPTLHYRAKSWMLTHPAQYGSTPLKVPGEIADVYQKNVVSAHAHHWAHGMSPSGRFEVVESGGAFHPHRIAYVNKRVTKHRKWTQGYVLLDHGRVTLFQ